MSRGHRYKINADKDAPRHLFCMLATIREADEILVIDGGQIIDRGDHSRLLAAKGFYHNLYMSQFRGQAAATW